MTAEIEVTRWLILETAVIWPFIGLALLAFILYFAVKVLKLLSLDWYSAPIATVAGGKLLVTKPLSLIGIAETLPKLAAFQVATRVDTALSLPAFKVEREPETLPKGGWRSARMGWQIAGLTDIGLQCELNEDNFLMMETELFNALPCGLYVVADGMGGLEAGEVASQLTVDVIEMQFTLYLPTSLASFDNWLTAAALVANEAVLVHQRNQFQEGNMGSTLVMALVVDGQAYIANVGDSRAYHLSGDGIQQISVDHSLVEQLIKMGQLTREAARNSLLKNVIYSAIGTGPDMEISLYHLSLQPGDRLLLCSDDLSDMLTDEAILEISHRHANPATACQALVEAALLAGGSDNITAIIVQTAFEKMSTNFVTSY